MAVTLRQRILGYIRDVGAGDFDALALALVSEQFDRLAGYREVCRLQGVNPKTLSAWRDIPTGTAPESGSVELEPEVIGAALPDLFRSGPLSLIVGSGTDDPNTVGPGVGAVLEALSSHAPEGSFVSDKPNLDSRALRSWLGARQRDRRPVRLAGADAGYQRLLDFLERRSLKFRLPPGSGAYRLTATKTTESSPRPEALEERLGLSPSSCALILCRGGATPLLETPAGSGRFQLPHWVRAAAHEAGRQTLFDLASLDAPAHRMAPVSGDLGEGCDPVFIPAGAS